MKDHNHHDIQMSEAFLNSAFLALSGGFQDAYTYNARDEVFCNAQTGNVVLMSQHFMAGQWMAGLSYFFPMPRKYRENLNMPENFTGDRESLQQKS